MLYTNTFNLPSSGIQMLMSSSEAHTFSSEPQYRASDGL